jgi:hypothetical protein
VFVRSHASQSAKQVAYGLYAQQTQQKKKKKAFREEKSLCVVKHKSKKKEKKSSKKHFFSFDFHSLFFFRKKKTLQPKAENTLFASKRKQKKCNELAARSEKVKKKHAQKFVHVFFFSLRASFERWKWKSSFLAKSVD